MGYDFLDKAKLDLVHIIETSDRLRIQWSRKAKLDPGHVWYYKDRSGKWKGSMITK